MAGAVPVDVLLLGSTTFQPSTEYMSSDNFEDSLVILCFLCTLFLRRCEDMGCCMTISLNLY